MNPESSELQLKPKEDYGFLERFKLLGLLVVIFTLLLTILFLYLNISASYEPAYLAFILNLIFIGISGFFIAIIAFRGFLNSGIWAILWLGIGTLTFALATVAGSLMLNFTSVNVAITFHNILSFFAALLFFLGGFFILNKIPPKESSGRFSTALQVYVGTLIFVIFIAIISIQQFLPPFFVEGVGGSVLRQLVVGVAALLFLLSGIMIFREYLRSNSLLLYWFSLGLFLMSLGMGGILLETATGTPLNWMGRIAQLLGGVYLLMATLVTLRTARERELSAGEALASFFGERKENLNLLFDSITDAIIVSDLKNVITGWNKGAEKMYGWKAEEAIGNTTEFLNTHYTGYNQEEFINQIIEQGYWDGEAEQTTKDGRIISILCSASIIKDDNGEIIGFMSANNDFTERKKAEEELQAILNLFYIVLSNMRAGVLLVKENNRVEFANEAFCEYFGLSEPPEDLIGLKDSEMIEKIRNAYINPDKEISRIREIVSNYQPITGEEILMQGGRTRIRDFIPLFVGGEPYGRLWVHTDITEIKQAEEKLRQSHDNLEIQVQERTKELSMERQRLFDMLEELPVTISLLTPDYHVKFGNRAYRETFGESHGRHCFDFIFGFDEPCHWCEAFKPLETGKPHFWELKTPDGLEIENYNIPITDSDGSPLILEMNIDVTDKKQAERQLKETINELERSNKELQSFAYITSHDLQEPLRSIASYAQLIERRYRGKLDKDADEFLEFMVSGATRMKDQIQGLLDYSRVDSQGKEFREFNAGEALNTALSNLKYSIEECHAKITYDSLPLVTADENQITRVFQNLIGNALKFRKEGVQPEIHISSFETKDGKGNVFSVSDNGIGIEEEYVDNIFEVFKRLHPIGEYKGAGIGLAIVKRIVERHGGRVWVESKFGVGSTFYFSIPFNIV